MTRDEASELTRDEAIEILLDLDRRNRQAASELENGWKAGRPDFPRVVRLLRQGR